MPLLLKSLTQRTPVTAILRIAYSTGKPVSGGERGGGGILSKLGEILYLDKSTLTVLRGVEHG